jgi:phosphate/sulfate permease
VDYINILGILGFCLAAYSVVGNDSIQTLGTFLSSNEKINWKWLWGYVSAILVVTLSYSWVVNGGDIASGRLDKIPMPIEGIQWYHVAAPAILLFLTRFGFPVSTTFLVLSVFASTLVFEKMLIKSAAGYAVAATFAYIIWFLLRKVINEKKRITNETHKRYWSIAQWCGTGLLWSQWLMHDMANIVVFLPRQLSLGWLIFVLTIFVVGLGTMLRKRGGKIQEIVLSKSGSRYVRSATIIDIVYAIILLVFKEWSDIPMSTTWVFVGLLCGRELAVHSLFNDVKDSNLKVVFPIVARDFLKILAGLGVSIGLVFLVHYVIR